MATRTRSNFKSTKNLRYTTNGTGDITGIVGNDMWEDAADSFYMREDLLTEWDMSTEAFPSNSYRGQDFNGVNGPTATLFDVNGDPIPNKVLLKSLVDNASTTDAAEWAIIYTIN